MYIRLCLCICPHKKIPVLGENSSVVALKREEYEYLPARTILIENTTLMHTIDFCYGLNQEYQEIYCVYLIAKRCLH